MVFSCSVLFLLYLWKLLLFSHPFLWEWKCLLWAIVCSKYVNWPLFYRSQKIRFAWTLKETLKLATNIFKAVMSFFNVENLLGEGNIVREGKRWEVKRDRDREKEGCRLREMKGRVKEMDWGHFHYEKKINHFGG